MSKPIVIKPRNALLDINVKEVWEYRGLISLFTKRNIKTVYAQTVLGPLWLVVSPIISALVSAFVFGNIAKISSDGVPYFLFFMCSNAIWSFFAGIITQTSNTFISNARLFSKAYFPRLVSPISTILTGFVSFLVQIIIFILFAVYFSVKGFSVKINAYILLLPLLVLMVCLLGLAIGLIMASVTAKYRDLSVLFSYGITLFMYVTPVIYPVSSLTGSIKTICLLNPMAPIIETVRYGVFSSGAPQIKFLLIGAVTTLVLLYIGLVSFNKTEKTFIDII